MRRSEDRILTTHTGSLPRPPDLTRLYVRRARGESVDPAEFDRLGREALRWIVRKQAEAGVDIGNNGEQQREGFFLHIRHRMSGFGGIVAAPHTGGRPALSGLQADDGTASWPPGKRSAIWGRPRQSARSAISALRAIEAECADFRAALDETGTRFVEPFLTAPSPGIIAGAMKNEYYDSEEAYLAALGAALKLEYETIVRERLSVTA